MTIDETIATVMRNCRNFFNDEPEAGTYTITSGVISPEIDDEWIFISGSKKNDGVYHNIESARSQLKDETFKGLIYRLHPPRDFIAICAEISAYTESNKAGDPVSESFGAYSYSKGTGKSGSLPTWQEAFSNSLIQYRRMFTEVD